MKRWLKEVLTFNILLLLVAIRFVIKQLIRLEFLIPVPKMMRMSVSGASSVAKYFTMSLPYPTLWNLAKWYTR